MAQKNLTGPPTKARYTCMSVCLSVCRTAASLPCRIGYAPSSATAALPNQTQPNHIIDRSKHIHRASSVLNRNVREFGVARLFDGSHDSCWNSEQVYIKMPRLRVVDGCMAYTYARRQPQAAHAARPSIEFG